MTTSFFNGESTFPENNTTDQLVDALTAQLTASTADSQAAQAAATAAAASASNAAISEGNVAGLSQAATDTLAQANDALAAANDAIASTAASAISAATSASAASASASTAGTAAGQASVSETTAAASASAALASKNAAGTSETSAAASATAANTSKVNAGTSESNAASSAAAALASKNAAGTSESNAATSAAAALTSKNNAATSEASAASSASASAASALVAQNFTASLAGKNRIINGDFRVNQRGNGVTVPAGSVAYGPDRWFGGATSGPATLSNSNTRGNVPVITAQGGTGITVISLNQRIETQNIKDLAGAQVTLSGYAYHSAGTSGATVNLAYPSAADNYTSSTSYSTLNLPTLPAGTWVPFSLTVTLPAGVTTGLGVQFVAALASGQIFALSDIQLEAGSVATPFERRAYGHELSLCQRYYEAGQVNMQSPAAGFFMQSLSMVPKRAIPTVAFSNTTYGSGSGLALNAAYVSQVCLQFNASAGNGYTNSQWTASAEL